MPNESRTYLPTKEHSIANNAGGANVGNGGDDHAPVGVYNSWTWRELVRFNHDFSGWADRARLVSAEFKVKTSNKVHLNFGASPKMRAARIHPNGFTASGGSENSWGTGGTVYPGPAVVDEMVLPDITGATVTVDTLDCTDLFETFLPTTIQKRDGTPGAGNVNNGVRFRSFDESGGGRNTEWSSMRGGYQPRLVVTMLVEDPHEAPVLDSPVGVKPASQPYFLFTPTGTTTKYDVQVSIDPAFGTFLWNASGLTTGIDPSSVVADYAGSTQPSGVPIYWRARTANGLGIYGPWGDASYSISAAPTATVTSPTPGGLAEVWNLNEVAVWVDGASHAKPRVRVAYAHPGGVAGSNIRVSLYTTADVLVGSPQDFPGTYIPGTTYPLDVNITRVRNTSFKVAATATAGGITGAESARVTCRMQWGQGQYTQAIGAATSDWRFASGAPPTGASAAFLFRSRGASTGPWTDSIGAVDHDANLDILVRLSTTGPNPTLPSMRVTWSTGTAALPDHWLVSGGALTLDSTFRRFGVKSFKVVSTGGGPCTVSPNAPLLVSKNTVYTWSTYVHTGGGGNLDDDVKVVVRDDAGADIAAVDGIVTFASTKNSSGAPEGWQRIYVTINTGSKDLVLPCIVFGGATVQTIHLDGHQLEEGGVASGWRPGLVGQAVVVDVGGLAVDATKGGTFQLTGSASPATGTRDVMALGAHGLVVGGATSPVEVHSPQSGVLHVGAPRLAQMGAPAAPPAATGIIYLDNTDVLRLRTPSADNPIGGSTHPNLATHDALGLATDAELTTHAGNLRHPEVRTGVVNMASINNGAIGNSVITLSPAMPDANYVVTLTQQQSLPRQISFSAVIGTASQFTIYALNNDGAARAPTVLWSAIERT